MQWKEQGVKVTAFYSFSDATRTGIASPNVESALDDMKLLEFA